MSDYATITKEELHRLIDDDETPRHDLNNAMRELHRRELAEKETEMRYLIWLRERDYMLQNPLTCRQTATL